MNLTQRWILVAGAVVVVLVAVVGVFFFTRPPAAVVVRLEGIVARGAQREFIVKDVQVLDRQISLCSLGNLPIQVEVGAVDVKTDDKVEVKGEYNASLCRILVKSAEHYVKVTVSAPVAIELEGIVARSGRESFTLSNVSVLQGPQPCSLDRLAVQITARELIPQEVYREGDKLALKGEYSTTDCTVRLSVPTHYVEVRPVSIDLEGIVAEGTTKRFTLKDVSVLDGPEPCTLDNLTVQVKTDRARVEEFRMAEKVRVKGEYRSDTCRVELAARDHLVERLPTAIKLQGIVTQISGEDLVLNSVKVLSGPQPCTADNLAVRVRTDRAAGLGGGEDIEVTGEYNPKNCQVSVEQPTHSLALLSAPQGPRTPSVPGRPTLPGKPRIPTVGPIGGLPFFISGGVSAIGPVMAFHASIGMAVGGALKGMLSVGYGSGAIQKPELVRPVNFTVIPIDFTMWYQISGGLHIGGGAGVLIVQGPKPKFSNTVPTIHIAVGYAISDFLMLSGGIAYVP